MVLILLQGLRGGRGRALSKNCLKQLFSGMDDSGRSQEPSRFLNEHSVHVLEELKPRSDRAISYQRLVESIHRRQELLLSYNIGLDSAQRERDMNKRAAGLVGLRMPNE